jgi:hypothetical protein
MLSVEVMLCVEVVVSVEVVAALDVAASGVAVAASGVAVAASVVAVGGSAMGVELPPQAAISNAAASKRGVTKAKVCVLTFIFFVLLHLLS